MKAFLYIILMIALISAMYVAYEQLNKKDSAVDGDAVMCTADAMICPDGTAVGRTGPQCEFVCPDVEVVTTTDDEHADLIHLTKPNPEAVISSPLDIVGEARGTWFFEASFPVILTDWDGKIIAEGFAKAGGDWMTEDFVPFVATLTFTKPAYGDRGTLILKKDNPSGLPEHDDALEITVWFNQPDVEVQ
ncbi:hypothetical protein GW943_00450 [Candidatus Parcubacteria bacterium]|uniref:Bacterial spore germination immunoglobulin-like domain-containing protein n=1 Tax=Candidatus Kaiserbacteria bacterium CG10_big_fil_rev_8_21_14_0_10_47_16 TaxID=1974608 RepID=A0A2H0UF74_9BACT|nr:hypothetical protein [Candidatus Parcubacteria bacterium]PIR84316.1 MAG: hypothetical protein COU16_01835 [Candidatus Kaiserbacteria bacterium CG10_big_fil_rev_8_21_14_0_10_47_16]